MTSLFLWSNSYDLGIATIDAQHKKLFRLLNELYDALAKNEDKAVKCRIIDELITFSMAHFEYEERLFQDLHYDGRKEHIAAHERLKREAGQKLKDYAAGKVEITSHEVEYNQDWLLNHILEEDKQYVPFFTSKGVK